MPKPTEFHAAIARALEGVVPRVVSLDETPSTNDVARDLAREGAPAGTVVVADLQTAGRGRLDRTWHAERGASLTCSIILRPDFTGDRWTLIPLMAGVAAAESIRARTGVAATLKWPNDILVGERKTGGILVEAVADAVVIGLGINVSTTFPPDLAVAGAAPTSLAAQGATRLDRADLLRAIVQRVLSMRPDDVVAAYKPLCVTLGRDVRVERAGGVLHGVAEDVDATGALVVDGERVVAGDVVHVRHPEGRGAR